jgi:hypothetical protein
MSLKTFHIFFIALAIVVTLFFGTWLFITVEAGDAAVRFSFGALSYAIGVLLLVYGRYFLRRFRHVSYF